MKLLILVRKENIESIDDILDIQEVSMDHLSIITCRDIRSGLSFDQMIYYTKRQLSWNGYHFNDTYSVLSYSLDTEIFLDFMNKEFNRYPKGVYKDTEDKNKILKDVVITFIRDNSIEKLGI